MKLLTDGILRCWNIIPPELREFTYMAGGAAYCFETARDVDMWICIREIPLRGLTTDDISIRFGRYLDEIAGSFDFETKPQDREKYQGLTTGSPLREGIHFQGCYTLPGSLKEIDVLVAECASPDALISEFDIDIHARAIGFDGGKYGFPTNAPSEIIIRKSRTPERTVERAERFAARYGLPIRKEGLERCLYEIQCAKDAVLVAQRLVHA